MKLGSVTRLRLSLTPITETDEYSKTLKPVSGTKICSWDLLNDLVDFYTQKIHEQNGYEEVWQRITNKGKEPYDIVRNTILSDC